MSRNPVGVTLKDLKPKHQDHYLTCSKNPLECATCRAIEDYLAPRPPRV